MFESSAATWISVALLALFWWGLGLLLLAMLGDVSPCMRAAREHAEVPEQSAARVFEKRTE